MKDKQNPVYIYYKKKLYYIKDSNILYICII